MDYYDCCIILDDALYIIIFILNCWLLTTSYKATGDMPEYTYIEEIMEPDTKISPHKKMLSVYFGLIETNFVECFFFDMCPCPLIFVGGKPSESIPDAVTTNQPTSPNSNPLELMVPGLVCSRVGRIPGEKTWGK